MERDFQVPFWGHTWHLGACTRTSCLGKCVPLSLSSFESQSTVSKPGWGLLLPIPSAAASKWEMDSGRELLAKSKLWNKRPLLCERTWQLPLAVFQTRGALVWFRICSKFLVCTSKVVCNFSSSSSFYKKKKNGSSFFALLSLSPSLPLFPPLLNCAFRLLVDEFTSSGLCGHREMEPPLWLIGCQLPEWPEGLLQMLGACNESYRNANFLIN